MLQGIAENAGTIAVSLALIGVVAGIVAKLRRDRKKGKSSCGCGCANCAMNCSCHKNPNS